MPDKFNPSELEGPNAATKVAMEEARRGGLSSFEGVPDLMDDLNATEGTLLPSAVPARP